MAMFQDRKFVRCADDELELLMNLKMYIKSQKH